RAIFPEWYDGSMRNYAFIRTNQMNDYLDPVVMLKNLFYMPSEGFITPFWSLTYEVIFYLLAPYLMRRVNLYMLVSLLLFAAHMIAPAKVASMGLHPYIHNFFFVYNIYFAAGAFLYVHFDRVM